MAETNDSHNSIIYSPVVSVLGHVDHGKTSLLDKIRKTNAASRESGGITQSIGASEIELTHEGKKRGITFIDTPGHLAFANMRAQGVNSSDIVLLIVAADDGVMPQTKESVEKILEAKTPFIVVITKIDTEGANIEKVKRQLSESGVLLEGLGGNVPFIGVSSKTGQGIEELLELILLVYDLNKPQKDAQAEFLGVIIESKLDPRRGSVATVVVKQGLLSLRDSVYIQGKEVGKVKALFNTYKKGVQKAAPGEAVEILGLTQVLPMGDLLYTKPVDTHPAAVEQQLMTAQPTSLADFFKEDKESLHVILKTETSGEIEAIKNSLPEDVTVIFEGQGEISVSDVLMALDFKAIILSFNVGIAKEAKRLAETEHVFYKTYTIIYELLDEIQDAIEAMQTEDVQEVRVIGKAEIIASFPTDEGKILGVRVTEGRLAVGDTISIVRSDEEIGSSTISQLKRGKNPVKEVGKGNECGVTIQPFIDFAIGDVVLSHK